MATSRWDRVLELVRWLLGLFRGSNGGTSPEDDTVAGEGDASSSEFEWLTGDDRRNYRDELKANRQGLIDLRRALWSIQVEGGPSSNDRVDLDDPELRDALERRNLLHLAQPIGLDEALGIVNRHAAYLGPTHYQDLANWLAVSDDLDGNDRVQQFIDAAPNGRQNLVVIPVQGGLDDLHDVDFSDWNQARWMEWLNGLDGVDGVIEPTLPIDGFDLGVEGSGDGPSGGGAALRSGGPPAFGLGSTGTVINHPDYHDDAAGIHVTGRWTFIASAHDGVYLFTGGDITRTPAALADNLDPQNWNYLTTFIDLAQRFDRAPDPEGIVLCDAHVDANWDPWVGDGLTWEGEHDLCEVVDFGSPIGSGGSDFKNRFETTYEVTPPPPDPTLLRGRWDAPHDGWLDPKLSENSGYIKATATGTGCELLSHKLLKMRDPVLNAILDEVFVMTVSDDLSGFITN